MQVQLRVYRSVDELIAYLAQVVRSGDFINWGYWRENLVAFSQDHNEYWRESTYKIYSRDGLVLVVKVYDSGESEWSIESVHEYCG